MSAIIKSETTTTDWQDVTYEYDLVYDSGSEERAVRRKDIRMRAGGDHDHTTIAIFERAAVHARGELNPGDIIDARRSGDEGWKRGVVSAVQAPPWFAIRYDKDSAEELQVRVPKIVGCNLLILKRP